MRAGRVVPVHYLRPNHAEWTPPVLCGLDTETYQGDDGVQTLRLWCASVVSRPDGHTDPSSRRDASGDTRSGLAVQLDEWSRAHPTLWVYAHNLAFDMAVSRLPVELCALGWEITDYALDGRSPWMRLSRGRRRITLADSWSWVPSSLDIIGGAVGIAKPALPDDTDSREAWMRRCSSDVDILMAMMGQLMDWWETEARGKWSVTGAASGWNAYRHIPTPYKVVIDPDEEGISLERAAVYGGRRSVARVGPQSPSQYVEADFERAYTVAARDMPLPFRRMRRFESLPIDSGLIGDERWGLVAEVTIETDRPRWPVRAGGRVWYPVGRFRTTLAGPEIADARDRGALRAIHKGHSYRLAPHMRPWATWCLGIADERNTAVPVIVRMVARQWGRSVVGKWSQRKFVRVPLGPAPTLGWGYEQAWMAHEHVRASIVDIGGTRSLCYADGNGENAFPAVLAYIESYVRVALNKAIDAVGSDAFLQCDTDGLIANIPALVRRARHADTIAAITHPEGDFLGQIMERISNVTRPFRLRAKRTYSRIDIIGPQHMRLDEARRFSGIPSSGVELDSGEIGAWTWPGIATQMGTGLSDGYVRRFHRYRVPRALAAGWITTTGDVRPPEWAVDASGASRPVPWERTRWHAVGEDLAADQTPDVIRLHRQLSE